MKTFWAHTLNKDIFLSRRERKFLKAGLILFLFTMVIVITACGKKQIHLGMDTSKHSNVDDRGVALPVVVRIYQLSNKDRLENADFNALWKDDRTVLEGDLLERREFTLQPETNLVLEVDPKKGLAYLGVMALFRKHEGDSWRKIISLKGAKGKSFQIEIHERSLVLTEQD